MNSNLTIVINLSTGEEQGFLLPPEQAVINAYHQSVGDWNTWNYPTPDKVSLTYSQGTVAYGGFCAKLEK